MNFVSFGLNYSLSFSSPLSLFFVFLFLFFVSIYLCLICLSVSLRFLCLLCLSLNFCVPLLFLSVSLSLSLFVVSLPSMSFWFLGSPRQVKQRITTGNSKRLASVDLPLQPLDHALPRLEMLARLFAFIPFPLLAFVLRIQGCNTRRFWCFKS